MWGSNFQFKPKKNVKPFSESQIQETLYQSMILGICETGYIWTDNAIIKQINCTASGAWSVITDCIGESQILFTNASLILFILFLTKISSQCMLALIMQF